MNSGNTDGQHHSISLSHNTSQQFLGIHVHANFVASQWKNTYTCIRGKVVISSHLFKIA